MKPLHFVSGASRQRGAALMVAVVLLLLAGIMTVLALNVGVFENRSTANDIRAKVVNEVAEAGLAQGFEYLMRQQADLMENPNLWRRCRADEREYPCGAISAGTYDHDRNPATPALTRRETMWRLVNSGHADGNFDGAMVPAMLRLPNKITHVGAGADTGGGFPVAYGVAPVVCFTAQRQIGESPVDPVRCATDLGTASNRRVATFVSVARMPGEAARTTLTQTVGRFSLLDTPAGKPPLISSGSVNIKGGLQIVTNPNSGGSGVPVSVWTPKDVDKHGTVNTCYADEFFRFGFQKPRPPGFEGTTVQTIVCDTCTCNGDQSLSYSKSGKACKDNTDDCEGIDILDVEGNSATPRPGQEGFNYNVRSDALSYPLCEFPPDLFAHVFGVETWEDRDHDCFGETKVMAEYTNPNNGEQVTMGADEAFLYSYAMSIVNPTPAGSPLVSNAQVPSAGYPSAQLGGLVWCQSNCTIDSNTQLGTPDNPVVLVIDDNEAKIHGRVFGLIFIRTRASDDAGFTTLTPAAGYTMTPDEVNTGGNASLDMQAGAAVYGSLVIQGEVKANGTSAVIYDKNVLEAIGDNPNNNSYATLPGAWNDNSSY